MLSKLKSVLFYIPFVIVFSAFSNSNKIDSLTGELLHVNDLEKAKL